MQDRIVQIVRICELEKDNLFMWQGTWFRVVAITEDKVIYVYASQYSGVENKKTFGVNSRQFVEVYRKTNQVIEPYRPLLEK